MKKPKQDDDYASAVGAEIRRIRGINGWTLEDAAEYSGVPSSTWDRFERLGPRLCWLPLIAETLEVPLCDLLELALAYGGA